MRDLKESLDTPLEMKKREKGKVLGDYYWTDWMPMRHMFRYPFDN